MSDALRAFFSRLRAIFSKTRLDDDFNEELAGSENENAGMTPEDARRAALVRIGGRELTREIHRETRGLPFLEVFSQDFRYAVRTLRRDAGFFIAAVCIVGLGIGASATIFSVVNALLLRPLPFHDPAGLVWKMRSQSQSFSDMAAYFAFYGVGDSKLTGSGEPERLTSVPVSQNFFPLLGVQPQVGRLFNDEECKWNGPKVVLLNHGLWKRRFGSDPSVVGRALTLDDALVTVVGVLPASFDFGSVFAPGSRVDLYSPFPLTSETNRWGNTLSIVGRLKAGASVQSAQAESAVLGAQINKQHPDRNAFIPVVKLLTDQISGKVRPALILLAGAVGVVMLIVCANLSNLLLARGAARQKEMVIRSALGAAKGRLIRQVLTESLMLSCCGALLGLLLAVVGTWIVAHLSAVSIPLLENVRIDGRALFFTLLMAVLTGLLFGFAPALRMPQVQLSDSLSVCAAGGRRTARSQFPPRAGCRSRLPSGARRIPAHRPQLRLFDARAAQRVLHRGAASRAAGFGNSGRRAHRPIAAGTQSNLGSFRQGAGVQKRELSRGLRARRERRLPGSNGHQAGGRP